jgi:hypothetical protein
LCFYFTHQEEEGKEKKIDSNSLKFERLGVLRIVRTILLHKAENSFLYFFACSFINEQCIHIFTMRTRRQKTEEKHTAEKPNTEKNVSSRLELKWYYYKFYVHLLFLLHGVILNSSGWPVPVLPVASVPPKVQKLQKQHSTSGLFSWIANSLALQ